MAAEQGASWSELPLDSLTDVLSRLPAKDLAACASVCTAWRAAADQQALWSLQRQQDFPQADDATLAVLLARAGSSSSDSSSSSGSSSRRAQRRSAAKLAYWWLAREWTCERCQQRFTDGANSPSACCFHTGILFSGGLMNGEALRYTCCNRRAHQIANGVRDSNGCTSAFHCGGRSAWQRHGTVSRCRHACHLALPCRCRCLLLLPPAVPAAAAIAAACNQCPTCCNQCPTCL
jgi:hypothetical protein